MLIHVLWVIPLGIVIFGMLLFARSKMAGGICLAIGLVTALILGGIFGGVYMSKMNQIAKLEIGRAHV